MSLPMQVSVKDWREFQCPCARAPVTIVPQVCVGGNEWVSLLSQLSTIYKGETSQT